MGIRPELYAEETDTWMVLPVTKSLCEPTETASLSYWLLLLVMDIDKCSLQIYAMGNLCPVNSNVITVTFAIPVTKRSSVPVTNMWFSRISFQISNPSYRSSAHGFSPPQPWTIINSKTVKDLWTRSSDVLVPKEMLTKRNTCVVSCDRT